MKLIPYYKNQVFDDMSISSVLLQGFNGKLILEEFELIPVIPFLLPVILFVFLFSGYIYNDMVGSGIYYYTRTRKKFVWTIKKSMRLFGFSLFFNLIYVFPVLLLLHKYKTGSLQVFIITFLAHIILYSSFCYILSLLVNVFAVKINIRLSFLAIMLAVGIMLSLMFMFYNRYDNYIFKLNPISNIFISLHDAKMEQMRNILEESVKGFYLSCSILYFLLLSIVLTWISGIWIKKQDVSLAYETD
jgi:hypothetical protein